MGNERTIINKFGYCYYEIKEDYVHIFNLFVYRKFRRKGRAKEILQNAINEIRKTGYTGEIQIVADPDECSISLIKLRVFYLSMGLEVYERYV